MDTTFFIPGIPVAKGRPKLSTRGGFARAYTPAKTRDYETVVALYGRNAIKTPLDGPLCVDLTFTLPIPSSIPKKRLESIIGSPHIKRPDLDNLCKGVLDGLNEIAWLDDSQICELHCRKIYGNYPGVVVVIKSYAASST
jgi:Holliday junction resolvase RusA-like endonuclease